MRRFAFTLFAALWPIAAANSYVPPRPLVVAADWGDYGFKFLPQSVNNASASARASWGELFQLQADGTLKTLWKHALVNTPGRILVSPRGHVVMLDNWAGHGSPAHAIVIYDPHGKLVADLKFSQVVTDPKACPRCGSMDGPFITGGYRASFTSYGNADEWFLVLRDDKGKGPTVSLKTGKLKTVWNGKKQP